MQSTHSLKVRLASTLDQLTHSSKVHGVCRCVKEAVGSDLKRGTRIVLQLKDGAEEFAEDSKLTALVKTYSEFISFPIEVFAKQSVPKQVEDAEATAAAAEEFSKKKIEAEAKGEDFDEEAPEPVMKTEYEVGTAVQVGCVWLTM
jgi:HSP90 family molecular chaperone